MPKCIVSSNKCIFLMISQSSSLLGTPHVMTAIPPNTSRPTTSHKKLYYHYTMLCLLRHTPPCIHQTICLYIHQSLCQYIFQSVIPFILQFIWLSFGLTVATSVILGIVLNASLLFSPYFCLFISIYMSI